VQISKIKTIANAWSEVLKGNTTEEHKRRASICGNCSSAIHKKYLEFFEEKLTEAKGMICNECGCPLSAKIRSKEKCPKNYW